MFTIDKDKAKKILVEEFGYNSSMAELFLEKFPALDDRFAVPIQAWLHDRSVVDMSVEGLTIKQVMQTQDCNFLSAVGGLNDLLSKKLSPDERAALVTFLKTSPSIA